jgi:hypothetical protein
MERRVRISASPGMVALVRSGLKGTSARSLAVAEGIADQAASLGFEYGIPITADQLKRIMKDANAETFLPAVEKDLRNSPTRQRLSELVPAQRKFTFYGRIATSCHQRFKVDAPVSQQVYAMFALLRRGEKLSRASVQTAVDDFRRVPEHMQRSWDFNLRREAYCQRRLITDRALIELARKDPDAAAWATYADSFDIKLKGRPHILPVPHYFSAYYEFYRELRPQHFESQDNMEEILSVLGNRDFLHLAQSHYAAYAERRDAWQVKRVKDGVKIPKFDVLAPKQYALDRDKLQATVSTFANRFVAESRSRSHGGSLFDEFIDKTAKMRTPTFKLAVQRNRRLQNDPTAWMH